MAAVSEKFPAAMTPTPFARAAASMTANSSAVSPEEPTTTQTPRSRASSVLRSTASCEVMSTRTSTPPRASATVALTGTPLRGPPQAWPRSAPAADRATAEDSSRSSVASTASATARPVQPVAPATHTLRTGEGSGRGPAEGSLGLVTGTSLEPGAAAGDVSAVLPYAQQQGQSRPSTQQPVRTTTGSSG